MNSVGEQKGVDSLIVTDMINLARNRAISDAVLVSGDEDLRVGVQQAQEFGVRVHLVGIKPGRGSQSLSLLQEADTTHEWAESEISAFLTCRPNQPVADVGGNAAKLELIPGKLEQPLRAIALRVAALIPRGELEALIDAFERTHEIPRDIDAQLLGGARKGIDRDLDSTEKKDIRQRFIEACRNRTT